MPAIPSSLPSGAWRFLPTLALGSVGGYLAYLIDLPLPWLLGALITTTLISLTGIKLGSPGRLRKGVLVVIGVMLGSAFTPELSGNLSAWLASAAIMLAATAVMMVVAVAFSYKVAGHSLDTALYAGAPGGLSALLMMAHESGADLKAVGITHAVRILVLLLAIPPILTIMGHVDLAGASNGPTRWSELPTLSGTAWLVAAAALGALVGKVLRLPNALLFGPALVSSILHFSGMTHAVLPPALIALAQVVIGTSVGVRFVGVALSEMARHLGLAVVQALILVILAVIAAWVGQALTGMSVAAALLAYMPGGAPELSLVALSLNIEPAFVTSHHLLRITVLLIALPPLVTWAHRRLKS
ncbi:MULTISPECIES: AbrB family transcriptional regulator [Halomonas]|uniref:AbrB family transcriptional regulator n=1 Tax=Halomonas TaxID=2745 RepID=UPI001C981AF0|nr:MULTISPECIES: AbrB family transcriptional regulator [Halomonas]MBY6209640.1 AbrB family transcriptional regulator [Halomonas sp. DP3Y7-2]MBY6226821.1 AbrB family transcriptional regulator [Halomonas sp. DP3Y7-1]MCA0915432.1 AbrB family transcriptional regulator [Halomonas denitrificans]